MKTFKYVVRKIEEKSMYDTPLIDYLNVLTKITNLND